MTRMAVAAELRQWGKVLAESPLPLPPTFDNRRRLVAAHISLLILLSPSPPPPHSPYSSPLRRFGHSILLCIAAQSMSFFAAQSWQNICPIRASCRLLRVLATNGLDAHCLIEPRIPSRIESPNPVGPPPCSHTHTLRCAVAFIIRTEKDLSVPLRRLACPLAPSLAVAAAGPLLLLEL